MEALTGVAAGLAGLAQTVSIGSAFFLGGLLLRRSSRGGGAPERLLGLHLILAIGMGSLLLGAASTSSYLSDPLPRRLFLALAIGGNVATLLGLTAALWFNYQVFHGGQRAGRVVAGLCSALMGSGFVVYAALGGLQGDDLYGRESWHYVATMVIADLWLVSDALRFRRQLLRRLALGLAEPLVVDRLVLWAIASLARVALVLMAPVVSATVHTPQLRLALVTPLLCMSALLILAATLSLWLMLVPNAAYRRWVERRFARTD